MSIMKLKILALSVGLCIILAGCSVQNSASESNTSEYPAGYSEPSVDNTELYENQIPLKVSDAVEGKDYLITILWGNPDTVATVSLTSPSDKVYTNEDAVLSPGSITFRIPAADAMNGTYTADISVKGMKGIITSMHPISPDEELESTEESSNMDKYESLLRIVPSELRASTDLQTIEKFFPVMNTAQVHGISDGFVLFNQDTGELVLLAESSSDESSESLAVTIEKWLDGTAIPNLFDTNKEAVQVISGMIMQEFNNGVFVAIAHDDQEFIESFLNSASKYQTEDSTSTSSTKPDSTPTSNSTPDSTPTSNSTSDSE